jgi:hypothetical protein
MVQCVTTTAVRVLEPRVAMITGELPESAIGERAGGSPTRSPGMKSSTLQEKAQ